MIEKRKITGAKSGASDSAVHDHAISLNILLSTTTALSEGNELLPVNN